MDNITLKSHMIKGLFAEEKWWHIRKTNDAQCCREVKEK